MVLAGSLCDFRVWLVVISGLVGLQISYIKHWNYLGHTPITTVANPPSKFEAHIGGEGSEFFRYRRRFRLKESVLD
jgi:hypothetical protein